MKKRAFTLLLCLMLTVTLSAQATGSSGFFRRVQYGQLISYENIAFGYSLSIFGRFLMLTDEQLDAVWDEMEKNREPDDDMLYDLRIWLSPDYRFELEIEVKEPTYDSFETEVAKAPEYLDMINDHFAPENNVRMLHDGVLRETPAGTMLETAIAYDVTNEEGGQSTVVFLYYDIYEGGIEYCFTIRDYEGDYAMAQAMLDDMMQTARLLNALRL